MAATGRTTIYNFPIYQENDVCSYLITWNQAMQDVETVCNQISTAGTSNQEQINELRESLETVNSSITGLNQVAANLQTQIEGFKRTATITMEPTPSIQQNSEVNPLSNGDYGLIRYYFLTTNVGNVLRLTDPSGTYFLVGKHEGNPFKLTPINVTNRASDNTPIAVGGGKQMTGYFTGFSANSPTATSYSNVMQSAVYMFYDSLTNYSYYLTYEQTNAFLVYGQTYMTGGSYNG